MVAWAFHFHADFVLHWLPLLASSVRVSPPLPTSTAPSFPFLRGMHCEGMHFLTSCYAELELAWQKDVLEILRVLCGARRALPPAETESFLFLFVLFFFFFWLPACNPAKGRTNMELREKFILADGASQGMAAFRPRGRRSRPSSRGASPNRSTSVSSHACQAASPQVPAAASTPKVGLQAVTLPRPQHTGTHRPQHTGRCFISLDHTTSVCISSLHIFKHVLPNDP